MNTPRELIIQALQGSVFVLTFETDDALGYRSSRQAEVLRAFSIDLKQQTVEYELTQKGRPIRRRIEYSPSLAILKNKLPLTTSAFDLKFQGLRLTEQGVSAAERVSLAQTKDPWDTANCFDKSRTQKLKEKTSLRLADEELE